MGSVGGVSVLCSAVQWRECSPFSFVAILGLLLAWLFHPITRGAYALPVVELATSFTPCSICWRQ